MIESILLLRIWLWMILDLRLPSYQSLRRCHRCLKCCDWVGLASWFSTVVAIYFNCQPSEHRRNVVLWRGVGWYFLFPVSTYACPLAYCCCVLDDHSEWAVPPHPFSRVWLGEEAWAPQHWIWGARIRNLGPGADMGEVHISTCFCGGVEPIQR